MTRAIGPTGWLLCLRRWAGAALAVFVAVFVVATLRGEALALAAGDDGFCFAMGGTQVRTAPAPASDDIADHSHDCCDLGQCSGFSLLPPVVPPAAHLTRRSLGRADRERRFAPPPARRRNAHRPRGPPQA